MAGIGVAARSSVLVIDDSPWDLAVLTEALRSEHEVFGAASADAAFQLIRSGIRPDLLVLDVMLPGENGLSVCRRLKADNATADVPVIFVTSRDAAEDEEAGFSAGGVDYVTKPINPHLLRARVRTHIELKRARERLEKQNEQLKEAARIREQVEHISRHDLKNPLMGILNGPAILRHQERPAAEQRALLDMIEDAGRQMLEMINRSTDLLKMEMGTYTVKAVEVDILVVARRVVAALTQLARTNDVGLDLRLEGQEVGPSDVLMAQGEELLLYSMLVNLVKNALEASPPGSTATLSFLRREAAVIAIHNKGALPARIPERFFEKYATAGKEGGTGLGAYSARLIAKTLGGTIGFRTSDSDGTTITVTLPRRAP